MWISWATLTSDRTLVLPGVKLGKATWVFRSSFIPSLGKLPGLSVPSKTLMRHPAAAIRVDDLRFNTEN